MRNIIIVAISVFIISYIIYINYREGFETTGQSWVILQYDNRKLDNNFEDLMKHNQDYAKKQGYEYVYKRTGYDYLPPYWAKVKIAQELIEEEIPGTNTKRYKGVLWLDTDAVIIDQNKRLEHFLKPGKSFVASSDATPFPEEDKAPFNAGVWLVRNDQNGQEIIQEWMDKYDSNKWFLEKGKWATRGVWAGENYEQGAFSKHILHKYAKWISIIPWYIFQAESDGESAKTFIIHFAGNLKQHIPDFLRTHPRELIPNRLKYTPQNFFDP
jgi:hypothetical protein